MSQPRKDFEITRTLKRSSTEQMSKIFIQKITQTKSIYFYTHFHCLHFLFGLLHWMWWFFQKPVWSGNRKYFQYIFLRWGRGQISIGWCQKMDGSIKQILFDQTNIKQMERSGENGWIFYICKLNCAIAKMFKR